MTYIDIVSRKKAINNIKEVKDVGSILRSTNRSLYHEQIFDILQVYQTIFAVFRRDSLVMIDMSQMGLAQKKMQKFDLPSAASVFITRLNTIDCIRVLYCIDKPENLTTLIYLIELPNEIPSEEINVTYLGHTSRMMFAPVLLDNRRFLVASALDDCLIYEIRKDQNDNLSSPFLDKIEKLHNFGIICDMHVDKNRKSLLVHSYKNTESLNYFQKGLVLQTQSETTQLKKKIQNIFLISDAPKTLLLVTFKRKTVCYALG